jgi:hypothetical protein
MGKANRPSQQHNPQTFLDFNITPTQKNERKICVAK